MAADAFAVMREGMKGKVGIGKLALYGREYLVAVRPHERGIVMHTLHHAAEDPQHRRRSRSSNSVPAKVKPEEIKLARQVIGNFEGPLDLTDYKDEYREGLQRIIDAKIAGEEVVAPSEEAPPKVVNLMDALRKSLDASAPERRSRPRRSIEKPVKAVAPPKAAREKKARPRVAPALQTTRRSHLDCSESGSPP